MKLSQENKLYFRFKAARQRNAKNQTAELGICYIRGLTTRPPLTTQWSAIFSVHLFHLDQSNTKTSNRYQTYPQFFPMNSSRQIKFCGNIQWKHCRYKILSDCCPLNHTTDSVSDSDQNIKKNRKKHRQDILETLSRMTYWSGTEVAVMQWSVCFFGQINSNSWTYWDVVQCHSLSD